MKKETNNNIPKGFVRAWFISENEALSNKQYLEKSIYEKRKELVYNFILNMNFREWDKSDTEYIEKILNGDFDDA